MPFCDVTRTSKMEQIDKMITDASIFLTPPSSNEITIPNKAISRIDPIKDPGKPVFSLEDEDDEEPTLKIDFMFRFNEMSLVTTVCSKIFGNLSDLELVRASHVSKTWRMVVRYLDIKSGRRVSRYLRKRKKNCAINKENFALPKKVYSVPEVRIPFSSAAGNVLQVKQQQEESSTNDNTFKTPVASTSRDTYKQCPTCQSPARTAFRQKGHCTKCEQDFCLHCFYVKDKHSPTCQVIGGCGVTGSPRKLPNNKSRRYSMGSKDNKSRLKRL